MNEIKTMLLPVGEGKLHELKISPENFEEVIYKTKLYEIRKNDRNFKMGDYLDLQEYSNGRYTGRSFYCRIGYVSEYEQKPGYVVFSLIHERGKKDYEMINEILLRVIESTHKEILKKFEANTVLLRNIGVLREDKTIC